MGRRPVNTRPSDIPLFRDSGRGVSDRVDSGAFVNSAPNDVARTANALKVTANDITQAENRRKDRLRKERENAVEKARLQIKIDDNNWIEENRLKYGADVGGYERAKQERDDSVAESGVLDQFNETELLRFQLERDDLYKPEIRKREDDYITRQDNEFEVSVSEGLDIIGENNSRIGKSLSEAQEDDLPDLIGALERNNEELEILLDQTKSDGTPLYTAKAKEAIKDESQFQTWSGFAINFASRNGSYGKVAQAIEDNKLGIPVPDGKGGQALAPIRDYIKDPKLIKRIADSVRAKGKQVKADRELEARLDVGADYFWGRDLYNSHDAESKKALEAYEEIAYSAFTQAPALDGNNARSDDPEFDGKSKVDIAVPFAIASGKLPNRIRGYYDTALQTDNVEAWDSAGAIYKQVNTQNKYSDYDLFDDAQENNVIQYNHLRATGVSGEDAIKRIVERRDRHEIAPAITKQLREEWNKKVDPIDIGDSFVELDDFGDDNISDRRSQVAILQFKNRANVIGRNEFIDRQDRGSAKEIGVKDARKAFGFTNITGKKTFMELPPEMQPAFVGLDPNDLALKEQLNTRIQNGIERLDEDILPENMADNIVLQVDTELLTTSLNEDGRVPYRLYLTDTNGMMHDITNADGNTENPMLFSSKYAVEKASERTAKAIEKAEAKRKNIIASEIEADDIGDI